MTSSQATSSVDARKDNPRGDGDGATDRQIPASELGPTGVLPRDYVTQIVLFCVEIICNQNGVVMQPQLHRALGSGSMSYVMPGTMLGTGEPVAVKVVHSEAMTGSTSGQLLTVLRILDSTTTVGAFADARSEMARGGADARGPASCADEEDERRIVAAGWGYGSRFVVAIRRLIVTPAYGGLIVAVMERMTVAMFDLVLDARLFPVEGGLGAREFQARRCALHLGSALRYLAQIGICHRNVSPANVLVFVPGGLAACDPFGAITYKLGGFGYAKICTPSTRWSEKHLGVPLLNAPEQLVGDPPSYGPAIDLWQLGMCLCFAITGGVPPREWYSRANAPSSIEIPAEVPVSAACKSCISGLLTVAPANRLTAEGLLRHPWLTNPSGAEAPSSSSSSDSSSSSASSSSSPPAATKATGAAPQPKVAVE